MTTESHPENPQLTTGLVPREPRGWCTTNPEPAEEDELTAGYSFDLRPRTLTVVARAELSATLARIRFTADDGFAGFPAVAPEDHFKLFFDTAEDGSPVLPTLTEGRWSPRGLTYRDYTVRWFDAEAGLLDVDFVLHDHGVAGRWAASAAPGDRLGALGPRGAFLIKDVYPWYVLAADETALPALARWVEGLRDGVPVCAYIEVDGPQSHIALPTRADLTTVWCHRNGAPAGSTELLSEAIIAHDYPDREGFVWVAGEALSIRAARRFVKEAGFSRDHWDVDGYWRRGTVNHDHHTEPADG
ncbi:siderophore-interacting protein [Brevibacterium otitidis]|uniref:Siderophore-interacting protein n=1 Tax=Brevibacterium otitidis TaxID=53364 RepID=A0ABV5X5K6_9MICO|nr:siderophore-interacting protein [Brevibacterium otitidis]